MGDTRQSAWSAFYSISFYRVSTISRAVAFKDSKNSCYLISNTHCSIKSVLESFKSLSRTFPSEVTALHNKSVVRLSVRGEKLHRTREETRRDSYYFQLLVRPWQPRVPTTSETESTAGAVVAEISVRQIEGSPTSRKPLHRQSLPSYDSWAEIRQTAQTKCSSERQRGRVREDFRGSLSENASTSLRKTRTRQSLN